MCGGVFRKLRPEQPLQDRRRVGEALRQLADTACDAQHARRLEIDMASISWGLPKTTGSAFLPGGPRPLRRRQAR